MDLLKIIDKEAYFCTSDENVKLVSQITTDDIEQALEVLLESDDIGLGIDEDTSVIANPAQRIVFQQLQLSFKEVLDSRDTIHSEIDAVFAQAESKYLKSAE